MPFYRHEFELEGGLQPFPFELLTDESCIWNDAVQQDVALATHTAARGSGLVRLWLVHEDPTRSWTPQGDAWAAHSWKVTGKKRLIKIVGEKQFYVHEMGGIALEVPRFIATPRHVIEQLGGTFSRDGDEFVVRMERLNLQLRYVLRDARYMLDIITRLC